MLHTKVNILEQHLKVKDFTELEKLLDTDLGIKDKDIKKYIICHWVFEKSESLNDLNLS